MNDGQKVFLFFSWAITVIATFGSLYFSEVMDFVPCVLCWYQRIAMYPLVLILGMGFLVEDLGVIKYSLPLAIIGFVIAIYHNLIQLEIISEEISPCQQGISCSAVYVEWLGFITIPVLSLTAFTLILGGLVFMERNK